MLKIFQKPNNLYHQPMKQKGFSFNSEEPSDQTTLGKIFGGFTTKLWNHTANYTNDPLAFAFSINNQKIYNILDNKKGECAIYPHNSYGPCFGNGTDFGLHSGCIGRKDNWCASQKTFNYNGEHLNGAYNFQVLDYEVYHVIFE